MLFKASCISRANCTQTNSAVTIHILKKQNINFTATFKIPITCCAYCRSHRSFRWCCGDICYSDAINQKRSSQVLLVREKKIYRTGGCALKSNPNVLLRSLLRYAWDGERMEWWKFFKSIDHGENNIHKLVVRFRGIGIEL